MNSEPFQTMQSSCSIAVKVLSYFYLLVCLLAKHFLPYLLHAIYLILTNCACKCMVNNIFADIHSCIPLLCLNIVMFEFNGRPKFAI